LKNNPSTINFQYQGDLWKVVDAWCAANKYTLRKTSDSGRVYQRGNGWLSPPEALRISHTTQETVLEALLLFGDFARAMAFNSMPTEMGIESGGYNQWLHRQKMRNRVNGLLEKLELPAIG
jgi:hypothetical protein